MSFTSVYDANNIGIDGFYYSGRDFVWRSDYIELLNLNMELSRKNVDVRFGPAFDSQGNLVAVSGIKNNPYFEAAIYLPKEKVDELDDSERFGLEIILRDAFNRLQDFVGMFKK